MSVKDRLKEYLKSESIATIAFESSIEVANGYVNSISKSIGLDKLNLIIEKYPKLNIIWLLTGNGSMLEIDSNKNETNEQLIPFYEDVNTIGGRSNVAETNGITYPSDYINAGDWFRDATAAIRHYGDSMIEYPSGCILALRQVTDKNFIIWGENYTIETYDGRITKRLQKCDDENLLAYSSNEDQYSDGRLIHEPIKIPKDSISKLFLVLGYVVKSHSSGPININK